MSEAAERRPDAVPEADSAALARRLILLGNQMLKLAGEVSRQVDGRNRGAALAAPAFGELPSDGSLLGLVAAEVYRDRRRRARHLPRRLLGEPAWDMLLDLYVSAGRGQAVSVSNACLAADVPASTALRWLQHLEDEGLVERTADPTDARRHFAGLTETGLASMNAFFAECRADLIGAVGVREGAGPSVAAVAAASA